MNDHVPQVTDEDVRRIVQRDYHPAVRPIIYRRLEEYDLMEKHRVRLAILKLSQGDLYELDRQLSVAMNDLRDVLCAAEQPRFAKIGFTGAKRLRPDALQELVDSDFDDYMTWLHAPGSHFV